MKTELVSAEELAASCKCGHPRVEHGHRGCCGWASYVDSKPCTCRRFVAKALDATTTRIRNLRAALRGISEGRPGDPESVPMKLHPTLEVWQRDIQAVTRALAEDDALAGRARE